MRCAEPVHTRGETIATQKETLPTMAWGKNRERTREESAEHERTRNTRKDARKFRNRSLRCPLDPDPYTTVQYLTVSLPN